MAQPLQPLPAPQRVLDAERLVCRADTPQVAMNVLARAEPAIDTSAIDAPALDLAASLMRIAVLKQQFDAASVEAAMEVLGGIWERKGDSLETSFTALKTAILNPATFGVAFLGAFLDFYLQDLIATAKLCYEVAVTLGVVEGCITELAFTATVGEGIDLTQYSAIADALGTAGSCGQLREIVQAVDALIADIAAFFDENGIVDLAGKAAAVTEEALEFLITLCNALPAMIDGPLRTYSDQLAADPERLGRALGITAAVAIGFALGIEELLVLATGFKALRPLVIVGGIFGPGENDGAPQTPRSYIPRSATRLPAKLLLATVGGLTAQELDLVRWLLRLFGDAQMTRRAEMAGVEADAIHDMLTGTLDLPEARRLGFRGVDIPSLLAARDLTNNHKRIGDLVRKIAPQVRAAILRIRYTIAPYGKLKGPLARLNGDLERLYYLARAGDLTPVERLDLARLTAQLQNTVFEGAHILDKAFAVAPAERADWRSVRKFRETFPEWFRAADPAGQMPAIAIPATQHRVNPLQTVDPWGVFETPLPRETVTQKMESLIHFDMGNAAAREMAMKQRRFIVGPDTTASEIVQAQQRIYGTFFPELHGKVNGVLDDMLTRLDEAITLDWTP